MIHGITPHDLAAALAASPVPPKILARQTGIAPRTLANLREGRHLPRAEHLVVLMRAVPAVARLVLAASGLSPVALSPAALADDLAALDARLIALRARLATLSPEVADAPVDRRRAVPGRRRTDVGGPLLLLDRRDAGRLGRAAEAAG